MIMNPPSHRILLASVNPRHLCFGITHLDENGANLTQTLAFGVIPGQLGHCTQIAKSILRLRGPRMGPFSFGGPHEPTVRMKPYVGFRGGPGIPRMGMG